MNWFCFSLVCVTVFLAYQLGRYDSRDHSDLILRTVELHTCESLYLDAIALLGGKR